MSAATSLSETAAFALGGWLYQGVGAVVALAIDAATYLVSALCVRALPRDDRLPPRTAAQPVAVATLRTGIGDGLRASLATPVLRVLAALELIVALGVSLAGTSYMIYVARDLALPTGLLGLIFATGGAGALIGAALAPRLGRRVGPARAMAVGLMALCIGSACIPLAGGAGATAVVLLVAHQLIGDSGHVAFEIHERTLRQTRAGTDMVARVDASIRTLGYVATLAGALGGGLFATHYGARAALVVCAALFALAALVAALGLKGMRPDAA
jgi:Na+/melibiose symporter-like transporter